MIYQSYCSYKITISDLITSQFILWLMSSHNAIIHEPQCITYRWDLVGWYFWVNKERDCWLMPNEQFFSSFMSKKVTLWWDDDDVHFVLDQHDELDCYSASWLKQHSAGRHVAPLRHNNLLSQPVFALAP